MSTDTKKPHLSVSQLATLSKCGEQYRRRYLEGEIIPPGVSLIVGRGVDGSVDKNLIHKVETEELLPIEAVRDHARDVFESSWNAGVLLTDEEAQAGIKKVRGAGIDKTIRLAELHAHEVAPEVEPLSVGHIQRWWKIELEDYPRDLIGVMDIQEKGRIRDTKTTGKSPPKNAADVSLQGTAYCLAAKVIDGEESTTFTLDHLVDTKTPVVKQLDSTRSEEDFKVLLRRIEVATKALEKGVFVPAQTTDWWCNERWCGYAKTCPYFHGRKSVAINQGGN